MFPSERFSAAELIVCQRALMARYTSQPVNTFSVGFKKYEQYNELEYARQVSREFGTNHREVLIDDRDALDYCHSSYMSQDEPIADWVCIPSISFPGSYARTA